MVDSHIITYSESFRCCWLHNVKAHSLTVSALILDGGLVVSGGYDRLIKVSLKSYILTYSHFDFVLVMCFEKNYLVSDQVFCYLKTF